MSGDPKEPTAGPSRQASPFDPPGPPNRSALETALTVVGGTVVLAAAVAVNACTGGLLDAAVAIPAGESPRPIDVRLLEQSVPGLAQTAPPRFTPERQAICTRCSVAVPFESMSLNEHGYFCPACARVL